MADPKDPNTEVFGITWTDEKGPHHAGVTNANVDALQDLFGGGHADRVKARRDSNTKVNER